MKLKPIIMAMILVTNLSFAQDNTKNKKDTYFTENYIFALWAEKQTKIPIGVILGISILENGWGESKAYNEKCNVFGFTDTKGNVMEFENNLECYKHFINLMNHYTRYSKVRFQTHWRYSLIEIKEGGWNSEDPFWVGKIVRIILDNKLNEY